MESDRLGDYEDDFRSGCQTSVSPKSPSQDYFHSNDQNPSRYVTPGFKSFAIR